MEILAFDLGSILQSAYSVACAALGLGLVIFFHELGHFAVAKWCGVFVERFSIGFGPILWSFKRNDTEYAISAVPFGGYVKMLGQDDMDPSQLTSDEIAQDQRSYSAKSVPQRMAIISAGVIMNIITALLFFAIAFRFGVEAPSGLVGNVIVGMPAWEKGIQPGDTIESINGHHIASFDDIKRGTALSRGSLRINGTHRDGTTFSFDIEPDANGLHRKIGIAASESLKLGSWTPDDGKGTPRPAVIPGTTADAAGQFLADDVIVEVGGEAIASHADLRTLLARRRSEPLDFVMKRGDERLTFNVAPTPFRDLGLWMDIEQVSSIVEGSPAALAGLKRGDKIISINGQDVGKTINPLHLSEYFEQLAGQEVTVRVRRADGTREPVVVAVTLTPTNRPAWLQSYIDEDTPLSIPSIGLAYHLTSNILKVVPDSPAAKAGVPEGAALKKISITSNNESFKQNFEELTGQKAPLVVAFDKPETRNMASAFWRIQRIPGAQVTITMQGEKGQEFTIEPIDSTEYFLPERGLIHLPDLFMQQSDSWGGAFTMAAASTRNNAIDIYLTIRNLITRDLSVKNLQGPLGIAKAAYGVSQHGIPTLMMFLGFLSVNLAVLNFLPIPVLDGGHMVFLIWEGVTRRRPSERVLIAATYCGMAFVLGLMCFVIYLDLFVHRA